MADEPSMNLATSAVVTDCMSLDTRTKPRAMPGRADAVEDETLADGESFLVDKTGAMSKDVADALPTVSFGPSQTFVEMSTFQHTDVSMERPSEMQEFVDLEQDQPDVTVADGDASADADGDADEDDKQTETRGKTTEFDESTVLSSFLFNKNMNEAGLRRPPRIVSARHPPEMSNGDVPTFQPSPQRANDKEKSTKGDKDVDTARKHVTKAGFYCNCAYMSCALSETPYDGNILHFTPDANFNNMNSPASLFNLSQNAGRKTKKAKAPKKPQRPQWYGLQKSEFDAIYPDNEILFAIKFNKIKHVFKLIKKDVTLATRKLNVVIGRYGVGPTALHIACYYVRTEIVYLLLKFKADPNIANNDGIKPLDLLMGFDCKRKQYWAPCERVAYCGLMKNDPDTFEKMNDRREKLNNTKTVAKQKSAVTSSSDTNRENTESNTKDESKGDTGEAKETDATGTTTRVTTGTDTTDAPTGTTDQGATENFEANMAANCSLDVNASSNNSRNAREVAAQKQVFPMFESLFNDSANAGRDKKKKKKKGKPPLVEKQMEARIPMDTSDEPFEYQWSDVVDHEVEIQAVGPVCVDTKFTNMLIALRLMFICGLDFESLDSEPTDDERARMEGDGVQATENGLIFPPTFNTGLGHADDMTKHNSRLIEELMAMDMLVVKFLLVGLQQKGLDNLSTTTATNPTTTTSSSGNNNQKSDSAEKEGGSTGSGSKAEPEEEGKPVRMLQSPTILGSIFRGILVKKRETKRDILLRDIVKILVALKVDFFMVDPTNGKSFFHYVANFFGQPPTVGRQGTWYRSRSFLDHLIMEAIISKAYEGDTDNQEVQRQFLEDVAEFLNIPDHDGHTALHYACERVYPEVIKTLLKFGADPSLRTHYHIEGSKGLLSLQLLFDSHHYAKLINSYLDAALENDTETMRVVVPELFPFLISLNTVFSAMPSELMNIDLLQHPTELRSFAVIDVLNRYICYHQHFLVNDLDFLFSPGVLASLLQPLIYSHINFGEPHPDGPSRAPPKELFPVPILPNVTPEEQKAAEKAASKNRTNNASTTGTKPTAAIQLPQMYNIIGTNLKVLSGGLIEAYDKAARKYIRTVEKEFNAIENQMIAMCDEVDELVLRQAVAKKVRPKTAVTFDFPVQDECPERHELDGVPTKPLMPPLRGFKQFVMSNEHNKSQLHQQIVMQPLKQRYDAGVDYAYGPGANPNMVQRSGPPPQPKSETTAPKPKAEFQDLETDAGVTPMSKSMTTQPKMTKSKHK